METVMNLVADLKFVALTLLTLGLMQQVKQYLARVEYEGDLNEWLQKGIHVGRLLLEIFSANDSEAEEKRLLK